MHLTYSRRLLTRIAPGALLLSLIFIAAAIWPTPRTAWLAPGFPLLCAAFCCYVAYSAARRALGGPALRIAPGGLWVGTTRGERCIAWREIEEIQLTSGRIATPKKGAPSAVILVVLREPGRFRRLWAGKNGPGVSVSLLDEGMAGAERWVAEARRHVANADGATPRRSAPALARTGRKPLSDFR